MKYLSPLCSGSCLHTTLSPSPQAECFSAETLSQQWQLQRTGAGWMSATLQPLHVTEPWPGTFPLHVTPLPCSPPTAASVMAKRLVPDFLSPCHHSPLINHSFCVAHDPEMLTALWVFSHPHSLRAGAPSDYPVTEEGVCWKGDLKSCRV